MISGKSAVKQTTYRWLQRQIRSRVSAEKEEWEKANQKRSISNDAHFEPTFKFEVKTVEQYSLPLSLPPSFSLSLPFHLNHRQMIQTKYCFTQRLKLKKSILVSSNRCSPFFSYPEIV